MPNARYCVVFEGMLLSHGVEREARQLLAALFRESPEQVGQLLDGRPRIVSAPLTRAKADEYADLLCNAGVAARVSDWSE